MENDDFQLSDSANSEVSSRENIGLLAYSPLAGGRLSGKYLGGKKKAGHSLLDSEMPSDIHESKEGKYF